MQELKDKKEELLEMNQKVLDKNFTQYNDNINLFYNLFFSHDIEIKPVKQGIKSLHFVIHPINIINFPLEIIFKLIQKISLKKNRKLIIQIGGSQDKTIQDCINLNYDKFIKNEIS